MIGVKRPQGVWFAWLWLSVLAGSGAAGNPGGSPDTTHATADTTRAAAQEAAAHTEDPRDRFSFDPADTVRNREFWTRHAFSIDHFFESWPRFVIGRRGPIGADAEFSRYGIGRGRGVLHLGAVTLNDPQDDRIPLALVPTTPFGMMVTARSGSDFFPDAENIEGSYQIIEPAPPTSKPVAAFELSKGDRDLRQRRVRISSIEGPVGVDFEFDEVLNDGYGFDARGLIDGSGYGRSSTRIQGGNLRGALAGDVGYVFSFRRFESVQNGDLENAQAELRRDGHVAMIRTSLKAVHLTVFERSHSASVPDSSSSNHTAGVFVSVPMTWRGAGFTLGAGYEDIHSRQFAGQESNSRLQKGHVGATGRASLPGGIVAVLRGNATHHFDMSTDWGAGVALSRRLGSDNHAFVELSRGFRKPNLAELFGPRHPVTMNPSIEIVGNRDVGSETALEGSAAWQTRVGGFTNEARATAISVRDPILYETVSGQGNLLSPENSDPEDLVVLEDRAHFRMSVLGAILEVAGSIEYSPTDKGRFFSGVPESRAIAWTAIERDFFKKTSGVRLSAEYQYGGPRVAGSPDELPTYDVVNLKLVVRVIDAHVYIQWLNVTDEKYQTVWPYLMTPRTFVYGLEWTIFD